MKSLLHLAILILACNVLTFAQTDKTLTCPTISVSGPSGVADFGDPLVFTAVVGDGNLKNIEYPWSLSVGEILSGQGTSKIVVAQPNGQLTAVVEVKGFPLDCPNMASETSGGGDLPPQAEELDKYADAFSQINKNRFEKIIRAVKNDPNSQLYVVNKYKKNSSQARIDKRTREVKNYLVRAGIDAGQITFSNIPAESDLMQFWLVPAGATLPNSNQK